jgi:hypothetical protein
MPNAQASSLRRLNAASLEVSSAGKCIRSLVADFRTGQPQSRRLAASGKCSIAVVSDVCSHFSSMTYIDLRRPPWPADRTPFSAASHTIGERGPQIAETAFLGGAPADLAPCHPCKLSGGTSRYLRLFLSAAKVYHVAPRNRPFTGAGRMGSPPQQQQE